MKKSNMKKVKAMKNCKVVLDFQSFSSKIIASIFLLFFSFISHSQTLVNIGIGTTVFANGTISVPSCRGNILQNYGCPSIGSVPWLDLTQYVQVNFTVNVPSMKFYYWGADGGDQLSIFVNGAAYNVNSTMNVCAATYSCSDWTSCGPTIYSANTITDAGPNAHELTICGVPGGISSFKVSNTAGYSGFGAAIISYAPPIGSSGTPTSLNCEVATSILAGGLVTSTVTGGIGGTITWAISPATGVSITSGSGNSTGAITFGNTGIYTVTFTSTNITSTSGCTTTTTTNCSRTITVNCAASSSVPVLEPN